MTLFFQPSRTHLSRAIGSYRRPQRTLVEQAALEALERGAVFAEEEDDDAVADWVRDARVAAIRTADQGDSIG